MLEPNIMSIGKAVAKLWPFLYIQDGRQRHLGFYQIASSAIRSTDPENPSTESNQTWSGWDAPFARYSPLNYTVTLKLGFGVTQGHRK